MKYLLLMTLIVLVSCQTESEREQVKIDARFKQKQDSIQAVLESLQRREQAAKDLVKNVTQICQLQLLVLENGSKEDSTRLTDFTLKMKELYPDSDRKTLRKVAMNIEPCEEYRVLSAKKRKK